MLAIRHEHAVESSQVSPGLRRQGSKPSHEIQWLEDDVGSANDEELQGKWRNDIPGYIQTANGKFTNLLSEK